MTSDPVLYHCMDRQSSRGCSELSKASGYSKAHCMKLIWAASAVSRLHRQFPEPGGAAKGHQPPRRGPPIGGGAQQPAHLHGTGFRVSHDISCHVS